MNIKSIFNDNAEYWKKENLLFFGVEARSWNSLSIQDIKLCLDKDTKLYWNSDEPCEIMRMVLSGAICRGVEFLLKNTIHLAFNNISECIDVTGEFINDDVHVIKIIMAFPTPDIDLSWIINKTRYTPRIISYKDYNLISSDGNIVTKNKDWEYDIKNKCFSINKKNCIPYKSLDNRSTMLLEAVLDETLTEKNFEFALQSLPIIKRKSIFNYGFSHLDSFFDIIRNGRKFASPLRNIPIAVNTIFLRQNDREDYDDLSNKLIISKSPIFALENFRTIVYNSIYNSSFSFVDTKYFFDAFKTSTNKSAGRHRLILDNVTVKNDCLYITDEKGKEYNMFQIMMHTLINGGYFKQKNISSISSSMFCNNNDPKRIMMTAKLSAQSIPTIGQTDRFTNRTPVRVVFGDFEGWSYGDSIIISQSLADKLESYATIPVTVSEKSKIMSKKSKIYNIIFDKIKANDFNLTYEDLVGLLPNVSTTILKAYKNPYIIKYEFMSKMSIKIFIKIDIPFFKGDKITNLHGSKGVVGRIMPDEEMPCLKNDIGNFKAGPFEVIISGFSVMRRGSLGQIFEAWATASGIEFESGEDFIKNAVKLYSKEMKDFSNKSIIEFRGTETIKPCGMIDMIRLYHHASTKVSLSYLRTNTSRMLKLGEMEKLNLAATNSNNILQELSIRSVHKYSNAYYMIYELMKDRNLPKDIIPSLNFNRLIRSMSIEMSLDGKNLAELDETQANEFERLFSDVVDNNVIDLEELTKGK